MSFVLPAVIGAQAGAAIGVNLFGGAIGITTGLVYGGAALGIYVDQSGLLARSLPDGPRRDRHAKNRITTRDEGAPAEQRGFDIRRHRA